MYKPGDIEASEEFNFDFVSQYFMSNPKFGLPFPLIGGYVCPYILLIHYMATCILIPRKLNIGHVSETNVALTWLLANKVKTHWESGVIYLMMERKRIENIWFPYGNLITKNLTRCCFNIEEEN